MNHLEEALSAAGLAALPKESTNPHWVKAIVLVRKIDGSSNYAIAENLGDGPSVTKDFGASARIARVVSVHPYASIHKWPALRTDDDMVRFLAVDGVPRSESRALLATEGKTPDQSWEDRRKAWAMVMKAVARMAIKEADFEARYRKSVSMTRGWK